MKLYKEWNLESLSLVDTSNAYVVFINLRNFKDDIFKYFLLYEPVFECYKL